MSVKLAVILWAVGILVLKVAQVWAFPRYRKTWNKWDRHRDPVGLGLLRHHPFHTLGWYVAAFALGALLLYLSDG